MSVVDVTFNSNDLQTTTRLSSVVMHEGLPTKRIVTQKLARKDGGVITGIEYTGKTITISGSMAQATQALLDTDIDTLKSNIIGQEGTLNISFISGSRNYIATCQDVKISRDVTHAKYDIKFLCVDPFGYATTATNHSYNGKTTSPYSDTATNAGTYYALPAWKVTFNSLTSITGLTFTNTTTNETLVITAAISAADVVIVNSSTCSVTINGSEVDYTGVFPSLAVGSNSFSITTPGTARNIDIDIDYTMRYL